MSIWPERPLWPRTAETNIVYAAGLVQGIVLVTFPAASTIFTDPDEYDLSSSQYGAMFLPQVVTAIAGALLGAGLAGRFGAKRVYLAGLAASLVVDGPARHEHAVHRRPAGRLRAAPGGHGLPRRRLRADRADPQHVHRRVPPRRDRSLGPRPQRPARAGHRPRPAVRRHLRRSRLLVGAPGAVLGPARRARSSPASACRCTPGPAPRPRRGRTRRAASRPASGCSPASRCSTASARRSTATGPSST